MFTGFLIVAIIKIIIIIRKPRHWYEKINGHNS